MSGSTSTMSASSDLHPDIMVQYLKSLGVTPETTRAIRDEVERKKAVDKDRLERKRANLGSGSHAMDEDDDEGGGGSGVREFARRQGADAAVHDGDSVMVWAILEGQPGKVEHAYRSLMDFVGSSWELYRAELEAVTFPVFVHCYLTLVNFGHADHAKRLMLSWAGEHEARYKDEVALLRMVSAKEHVGASEYCQMVLKHKFRVRMCLASSKLLNAFLVNMGLLVVMHILNTRVLLVLEDRSPLPSVQVVRCGPDDSFPGTLRRNLDELKAAADSKRGKRDSRGGSRGGAAGAAAGAAAGGGGGGGGGAVVEESLLWAAAPPMEVALLKQTERDAAASGLYYPLSLEAKPPSSSPGGASSSSPDKGAAAAAGIGSSSSATSPGSASTAAAAGTTAAAAATAAAAGTVAGAAAGGTGVTPEGTTGTAAASGGGAPGGAAGAQGDSPTTAAVAAGAGAGGGGVAGGVGIVGPMGGTMIVPTGSVAAAAARARVSRVAAAAEVTEATARRYGGLRQKQISLPQKPPPQPDPSENWSYLRLALRPLDPRILKDTLSTPEGGARPFVANPLSPHVMMLTFFNALDTLCCLKPTRDGMQVQ